VEKDYDQQQQRIHEAVASAAHPGQAQQTNELIISLVQERNALQINLVVVGKKLSSPQRYQRVCQASYPYDPSQQERPDYVLLVPVWTLSLNENSTHHFYGFLCCLHGPRSPPHPH